MSFNKELKKIGDKIDNATKDKDERAADCFQNIKASGIKLVNAKTGAELTHPIDSVGRISAGEGNSLNYCLKEYAAQGYISESDYAQEHPLHSSIVSSLIAE